MPYSGPGDESLPENVKKMNGGDRAQWVEVWNSAHKKCMNEGGDSKTCETSAFAQANGVVKGGNRAMDNIKTLWESVKNLFEPLIAERAAYPWKQCVADQMKPKSEGGGGYDEETAKKVCGAIKARCGGNADSTDIMLPDGFDLAKALAEIKKELSIEPQRMIAYLPTQTRTFTITRDTKGIPRWLMIAASAVINKVGAIDSTTLFDNFIRHATETNEYPVLDFFHEGERVRFGVADWLRRDGALYIASGTFDDTELARGAAAGLEAQPDYWGGSIAYRVTQEPLVLVAEGEIPVYTDGVNNFISIVPKRLAANLFTATLVAEEVRRMNEVAYAELVKLVGEERAKAFADQVDDANRTIAESGMVMRANEPPAVLLVPPAPVVPLAPTLEKPDDELLKKLEVRVTELEAQLKAGRASAETEQKRATDTLADLTTRLAGVEEIKNRWLAWVNDAPEYVRVEADKIYRARDQEPAPLTMAQLAEQNVSKLNRVPHQRHQG